MNGHHHAPGDKTQPSPPTLITSPLFAYNHNGSSNSSQNHSLNSSIGGSKPSPLMINTSSSSANGTETNAVATVTTANGMSCVKKRVWTPVQSTSSLIKTSEHTNFSNFNEVSILCFRTLLTFILFHGYLFFIASKSLFQTTRGEESFEGASDRTGEAIKAVRRRSVDEGQAFDDA
jgi:hypothetical protein